MSKEYWNYRDEDGETAYLAGALDVLSDRLSMYFDSHYTMDADIFRIRDNDISLLGEAVRRRLHSFLPEGIHLTGEEIDAGEMYNAYMQSYIDLLTKSNGLVTKNNQAAKARLAALQEWA